MERSIAKGKELETEQEKAREESEESIIEVSIIAKVGKDGTGITEGGNGKYGELQVQENISIKGKPGKVKC